MTLPKRGKPDFLMLFLTFALLGFGVLMVYSSSYAYALGIYHTPLYFTKKQIIFALIGIFLMFLFMNIRFSLLKRCSLPFTLISILLLILVLIIGKNINGAKRWLSLGGFGIQPTEFMKLAIVIFLSSLISKKKEKIFEFKIGLLPLLVVPGISAILILLQPDFGSCLIVLMTAFSLIVISGVRFKHLFGILLFALPFCIYFVIAKRYRLNRITSFLHPWNDPRGSGYQLIHSLFAFAHGSWQGVGIGNSIEKLFYLPEAHTDFIFSIIGEEVGFIGVFIFLLIYGIFLARGFIAAVHCKDHFGFLLGMGIVSMLSIQLLFNVGADSGLLPVTGVPLPLISYGGSSLLVTLTSIGILLSISREKSRLDSVFETKERGLNAVQS